jgi:hypothetical protein
MAGKFDETDSIWIDVNLTLKGKTSKSTAE